MFNKEIGSTYRYTVAGMLTVEDGERIIVYFEGVDDDGSAILSMYKSNAYFFNMRKDAIFVANALNAYREFDTFKPKLFTFKEYGND